jgi:SCF-associated factor 1
MQVLASGDRIKPLRFPAGYPVNANEAQYEEPAIAIRQFSAGRSHILGLSDSGRIWSWYDGQKPALHVKFANVDIRETHSKTAPATTMSTYGQVRQVVAGWSRSLAYVHGTGIVVWKVVERGPNDGDTDTMLVLENVEVPRTGYQRSQRKDRESDDEKELGQDVGAVLNFIDLENFVVFTTDIGRVFCGRYGDEDTLQEIVELCALRSGTGAPVDVQGSFRQFAVFQNGEVITTDQDYLQACWDARRTNSEQTDIPGLKRIPALQHNDVISVAFGDYHYMALHSNGKITSYGTELQACGALGLGGDAGSLAKARGVVYDQFSGQGRLLPHAYTHGRQVWFDSKRRAWIEHIIDQGGSNPDEANSRKELFHANSNVQGEVSEWIEQESKEWDKNTDDDGLGAYFALRVSAAGWHSGALVLVNEDLANKHQGYSLENKSFPRLRLSDGTEMPGEVDFDEWREGRPEWQIDGDDA